MRLLILCIVTVIRAGVVTGNFCGSGWFSYKHFCYMNDTRKENYYDARKKCREMGADLTSISNVEESEALAKSFQTIPGEIDLWIGFHRPWRVESVSGNSSGFEWLDGTPFNSSFDNWLISGQGEKHPRMGIDSASFYRASDTSPVKWKSDDGASRIKGFICKKETWDPTSEHCLEEKCYKMSASAYDNENEAVQECVKNNMTVLKHGQFPDSLNQTYTLDGSTPFWSDYGNRLERQGGTPAWVICTGPSDKACPCGWHGLDNFCYYIGGSKKNKNDSMQECVKNGGKLALINSHTENQFIKSILNSSQRYWIRNSGCTDYSPYVSSCRYSTHTVIQGAWWSPVETEENYYICKKKRKDVSPFDFCLDGYPGECYNSSQISVLPRNLNGASCASGMKILSEQMVKDRNISRNLAKAIYSPNVSCNRYWTKSDSGPKLLYAKNDAEIELKNGSSENYNHHYICVKDIDECSSSPCEKDRMCVDEYHKFRCTCLPGYTGEQCETEVDECMSQPCKHGATCEDEVNGFFCLCSPGYTGKSCETGQTMNLVNVVLGTLLGLIVVIILVVAAYCCVRRNSTHGASNRSVERDQGMSDVDVPVYDEIAMTDDVNQRGIQDQNEKQNPQGATGDNDVYDDVAHNQDGVDGRTLDRYMNMEANAATYEEPLSGQAATYLVLH